MDEVGVGDVGDGQDIGVVDVHGWGHCGGPIALLY